MNIKIFRNCSAFGSLLVSALISFNGFNLSAAEDTNSAVHSGNPIFPGWYADPEAKIFGKEYWVYPTYSAKYREQVLMDAFSSPDLVHWTKHPRVIYSNSVRWVKKALWAPAVAENG